MKDLLLLHGAIGSKEQLMPLANELSSNYRVHVLNFPGHGGVAFTADFSIPAFGAFVVEWLTENKISEPSIFGYSMGGYVAMYIASHYPQIAKKIITLGTKYHWTEEVARKETSMLNPEVIEAKVPAFAAQLQKQHQPNNWKILLQKTTGMLLAMGKNPPLSEEDFLKVSSDALVMLGDRDRMVTLDETVEVYKSLQHGHLCVLPDTPHPIEKINVKTVALMIHQFLH